MTELTDVWKKEHEASEKLHICFKELHDPENGNVRYHCHDTDLYRRAAHNNCSLKYWIPDHMLIVFKDHASGYDAHLYIKELGQKYDIG